MRIWFTKYLIISLCCVAFVKLSCAQETAILDNINLIKSNNKVLLNWTISSGSTCNGIKIYRTIDSLKFLEIAEIGGVCGSFTTAVSYSFTDYNAIKNHINYYKLQLGNNGFSKILAVEIIEMESGYQVRPNPIVGNGIIYFSNHGKQTMQLNLYNNIGTIALIGTTNEDYFDINVTTLPNGIYFFTISNALYSKQIQGKILVNH